VWQFELGLAALYQESPAPIVINEPANRASFRRERRRLRRSLGHDN
jgi:hypothetical protein